MSAPQNNPQGIPMSEARRIEAQTLAKVYEVLVRRHGQDEALAAIRETLRQAGLQAGRDFAAKAPGEPSLDHFATVIEVWNSTGFLTIENMRRDGNALSFDVVRCGYAEMYRELALPEELARRLSCDRDGPFAEGYSPRLALDRATTIAQGGERCPFRFRWE